MKHSTEFTFRGKRYYLNERGEIIVSVIVWIVLLLGTGIGADIVI